MIHATQFPVDRSHPKSDKYPNLVRNESAPTDVQCVKTITYGRRSKVKQDDMIIPMKQTIDRRRIAWSTSKEDRRGIEYSSLAGMVSHADLEMSDRS